MRSSLLIRVIAPSAVVGLVCAALNVGAIGPADSRDLDVATATTHFLADVPDPALVHRRAPPANLPGLVRRGELLAGIMATPPAVQQIALKARVPANEIAASNRTTASVPLALSEPGSERRAADIGDSLKRYRIEIQARQTTPVLDVYVQAPSAREAARLAAATGPGLLAYLDREARRLGVPAAPPIRLKQLGPVRAGDISGGAVPTVALLTFVLGFALSVATLLALRALRQPATVPDGVRLAAPAAQVHSGEPRRPDGDAPPERPTSAPDRHAGADDWPHTNRLVPWTIAVFMAVLWLVPFNAIELNASLPIDLKFDRLILPIVFGGWALAVLTGGVSAPRLRLTWVHVAIAVFVASAFASVVLGARYLNQTGEFDLAVKQLPLLIAYVSLFVIVASGVRRSEVAAFLSYTLGLAVLCGAGLIWEYRFQTNVFYNFSNAVLPGVFSVSDANASALDDIGRRVVRGPAEVGLEAVTMLSLALAISLVGFLDSKRWGQRVLYGLTGCILLAATFATFRKSALLAPVSVVATLAYFRRRHLMKLAPVGLVLIVMVQILSPGALRSTTEQFFRKDRTAVPTVSDRTADYDAIRPDLWAHPAFGRGFGTYNHETYRILDSEILHRTVETGVLGLAFFLLIPIAVIASARVVVAGRDRRRMPMALVGAAAGVCFLVASALYDVLSFPHATYIFLYIAGLLCVVVTTPPRDEEEDEDVQADAGAPATPPHPRPGPRRRKAGARERQPATRASAAPGR